MRPRSHRIWLAIVGLATASVVLPAIASSVEATPGISAYNEPGIYGFHSWMPATATVNPDGVVRFSNPYSGTYHGLKFTGGSAGATPSCTGIPQAATEPIGAIHWEGECTFSKPGTYTFICTVHPIEMKGTITVTNGEPTVTTEAATSVTEHEATLKGTVNPEGKATKYFFKWGATPSYGQETSVQPAGEGTADVPVSVELSGLVPGTPYHDRLVAENEKGAAEGADQTFTTVTPPSAPTATTGEGFGTSETEATLKGTVDPNGRPTTYFFKYGTTLGYGSATSAVSAGEGRTAQAVSAKLTELTPGATYHFQLVAENTLGTTSGVDRTFMIASPLPLAEEPPSSPPTTTPTTTSPPPTTLVMLPPPKVEEEVLSPLVAGSLKLTAPRHGSSAVRGSFTVAQSGAGGRLEVDLLAKNASLAKAWALRLAIYAGGAPHAWVCARRQGVVLGGPDRAWQVRAAPSQAPGADRADRAHACLRRRGDRDEERRAARLSRRGRARSRSYTRPPWPLPRAPSPYTCSATSPPACRRSR